MLKSQVLSALFLYMDLIGALLMYKARSLQITKKTAVTILGRQPDSHIWALGKSVFIDERTG